MTTKNLNYSEYKDEDEGLLGTPVSDLLPR